MSWAMGFVEEGTFAVLYMNRIVFVFEGVDGELLLKAVLWRCMEKGMS